MRRIGAKRVTHPLREKNCYLLSVTFLRESERICSVFSERVSTGIHVSKLQNKRLIGLIFNYALLFYSYIILIIFVLHTICKISM